MLAMGVTVAPQKNNRWTGPTDWNSRKQARGPEGERERERAREREKERKPKEANKKEESKKLAEEEGQ